MQVKIHYIKNPNKSGMLGARYTQLIVYPEKYDLPTKEEFDKFWTEVTTLEVDNALDTLMTLERAFELLQFYETNPLSHEMGGPEAQRALVAKGVGHTTAMVGDIFEVNGKFYLCAGVGWTLLWEA